MDRIITEFGAKGDGITLDTAAIQAAIDAVHAAGGGRVVVPTGTFVSGSIYLKSNCILYLEPGAVLLGSTDFRDYSHCERKPLWISSVGNPYWSEYWGFVIAVRAENVGIEGCGTIDGRGKYGEFFPNPEDEEGKRPFLLLFDNCRNVTLRNFTIKAPAAYSLLAHNPDGMKITGLNVLSRGSGNGDGLDFDGGRDVIISDCYVDAGDDAISLKTTKLGLPCERFVITNCILKSHWAAVRLGLESTADMRDIVMSNCVMEDCKDGLKIQVSSQAVYENIAFDNITMRRVQRPVFMTLNRFRFSKDDGPVRPVPGRIRNISFTNLKIDMPANEGGYRQTGFVLAGTPDKRIENVTFRDVICEFHGDGLAPDFNVPELYDYTQLYPEITSFAGDLPTCGIFARHVEDLRFIDCVFKVKNPDGRPIAFFDDVGGQIRFSEFSGDCRGVEAEESRLRVFESAWQGQPLKISGLSGGDLAAYRRGVVENENFLRFAELQEKRLAKVEACASRRELVPFGKSGEPFKIPAEKGTCWLYLPRVYGGLTLECEGRAVERFEIPPKYKNFSELAFDVTALAGKKVRILGDGTVRGMDGDVRMEVPGGVDCPVYFCH